MPAAALRPAPMARMTVAAPVTMSPPAKTPGNRRRHGLLVDDDVAPLVDAQPRRGLGDDRVRRGAERVDHGVHVEDFSVPGLGTGRRRPEASGSPSSIFTHSMPGDPARVVAEDLDRVGQPVELHALLHGVVQLLDARRRLLLAAAVDDRRPPPRPCASRRAPRPWRCCRRPTTATRRPMPTGVS